MSFGRSDAGVVISRSARAVLVMLLASACAAPPKSDPESEVAGASPSLEGAIFVDVAPVAGIDFSYFNGMSGEHYFHEVMGGGAALFDYDNDGDLDVYLVQGHLLGRGVTMADAVFPSPDPEPLRDRLYRNDLEVRADGVRRLRFTDVTEESGILSLGYGMGVAAGDYDNDGWTDLYVTNFGHNVLLGTVAMGRSRTLRLNRAPTTHVGRWRRFSWTSIATAGSISMSAITWSSRSPHTRPARAPAVC